jgi:signal transduction histidine kinase
LSLRPREEDPAVVTAQIGLFGGRRSIRYPILAIAWIPSIVLLLIGLLVAGVLGSQGAQMRSYNDRSTKTSETASAFMVATLTERRASEIAVVSPGTLGELAATRSQLDATLPPYVASVRNLSRDHPVTYAPAVTYLDGLKPRLTQIRERISNRQAKLVEVSEFYSDVSRHVADSLYTSTLTQPVARAASEATVGITLSRALDDLFDADALAVAAYYREGGLSQDEFTLFARREGGARSRFDEAASLLQPAEQADLLALRRSAAWGQVESVHAQVLQTRGQPARDTGGRGDNGNQSGQNANQRGTARDAGRSARPAPPLDPRTWKQDIGRVAEAVTAINLHQSTFAAGLSTRQGELQRDRALFFGVALLLLATAVFLGTTFASSLIVRRLRRLRSETLLLANERLPSIVRRLGAGQPVDVRAEMSPLQFGRDEIGQVAEAFEQAQRMAVTAAAREAETRAGLRTVFLDIAHRSQAIVHRQLKVLDQAERAQEDPDQLALLFQLDHLSTRARRNAENLIVLGGGQAGRQWRNPVPLIEITRSAISEAEDYIRVQVASLPRVTLKGAAVADVIHLLAELVDNATSFSPPLSRVEVRGNLVGRGVVIEVEDQGLGIEPEQMEQLNQMLHQPPDFQVMALADEPRLGLFVVGQLASRHGVRVTLTPSPAYGGTRVVVLLPNSLIASDPFVDLPRGEIPRGEIPRGGAGELAGFTGMPGRGRIEPPPVPEPRALGLAPGPGPTASPSNSSNSSNSSAGPPPVTDGSGRAPSLDALMAVPEMFAKGPVMPSQRDRNVPDEGPGTSLTDLDPDRRGGSSDVGPSGAESTQADRRAKNGNAGTDARGGASSDSPSAPDSLPAPQPLQPLPRAPQPPVGAPQPQPPVGAPQPQPPVGAPQPQPPVGAPQPQPPVGAPQPLRPGRFEAPLCDTGLFDPVSGKEVDIVDLRSCDAARPSAGITTRPSKPDPSLLEPGSAARVDPDAARSPHAARDTSRASGPGSTPASKPRAGRPELPRRTRQAHLSPRLRDLPTETAEPSGPSDDLPDAELARSRFAALQRGTLRGRETDPETLT